ncbi:structural maintenance of chromosome 3 (chondroitin sulfate proteoglycan 6) [Strigomonas culicis]|uniref:Structural maintenance of chromosome 3 (Chondroitin sulfate proteoglycan 6) n=1 Tax=Strigomonas culicis TaxID=28005 RepID=S9VXQ5_9TRYP|nr:structural maintenance of chromosome 3 (chondroitin sulfate proteoglycan 6) [Strigomonas culicis]|eukprot:EPY31841.1 structural maintenance of chromosome 3 (chondroitin sulfate proteoglycan 6) [Strigomonas culicis]
MPHYCDLKRRRKDIEADIAALNGKQAIAELNVNEASAQATRGEKERTALLKEKEQIESALKRATQDVTMKRSTFEQKSEKAKLFLQRVEESQKRLERMQEKRNRTKLFKSKGERDAWIQDAIKKNEAVSARAKAEIERLAADISRTDTDLKSAVSQKKDASKQVDTFDPAMSTYEKRLNAAYSKRDKLNQERRKQWQSVHEQEAAFQRIDENAKDVKRRLDRSVRYDVRQGLQSLKEILAEINDKKVSASVYGSLIDLITVEEGYETAVDITAGNTLFNVLVDNFETSAMLLQQMNKRRKPGRISFFPLDTCNATPRPIPTTADSSALISKIKFDKRFQGVVAEVFGRTAVVTSLDVGTRLSKEAQCDVVTIDGDQLGRRGGITGGYIDKRNSKVILHKKEKLASAELMREKKKLDELCQSVASTEQEILEILNEIELIRNNNVSTEKQADLALREARLLDDRISRLKAQKDQLVLTQRAQEKTVADAQESVKQLEDERKEDYTTSWTEKEENALEQLSSTLVSWKLESSAMQAEVLQMGTEMQLLEDTIQHLNRRKQLVDDRVKELAWSKQTNRDVDREHTAIKHDVEALSMRLDSVHQLIEKVSKEKLSDESKLEGFNSKHLQTAVKLQERKDTVDRTEIQRTLLIQRQEDALQKLKKLGVVPKGVEKFTNFSIGKLMYSLKETNEKIKKFSHVNRKALDQHTALLGTKSELSSRRESLAKERVSICELMDHLERQKHEAIERTYKQIQFQFEEVFKELVATDDCVAELQLVKPERSTQSEDPYIAARIRVSFGQGVPAGDIGHLSGGQKSLVALALIFAIQRCDPAPFYLFDEIDAALDAEYRTSVAKMIRKQSENCQFIIASFKTEILSIADLVLGIFFHNKVSRVQAISQEEGVKLLKQAAEENRKRSREPEQ